MEAVKFSVERLRELQAQAELFRDYYDVIQESGAAAHFAANADYLRRIIAEAEKERLEQTKPLPSKEPTREQVEDVFEWDTLPLKASSPKPHPQFSQAEIERAALRFLREPPGPTQPEAAAGAGKYALCIVCGKPRGDLVYACSDDCYRLLMEIPLEILKKMRDNFDRLAAEARRRPDIQLAIALLYWACAANRPSVVSIELLDFLRTQYALKSGSASGMEIELRALAEAQHSPEPKLDVAAVKRALRAYSDAIYAQDGTSGQRYEELVRMIDALAGK